MFQHQLYRAFAVPTGLLGRLGGRMMAHHNAATERQVVARIGLRGPESVLVLGPGPGVGVRAALERAGSVVAVDPSPVMLAMCRRRCVDLTGASRRLDLHLGTADRLPLPDTSIDVALAVNSVHLWPDRAAALAELRRVLRSAARLLISVHARWLPRGGELAAQVRAADFSDVATWEWRPPDRRTPTAFQLLATA